MATTVGSQKLVLDYSPECKGLQHEMPLQQALSLYGEAELIQADIPYYWDVFNETLDLMEEKVHWLRAPIWNLFTSDWTGWN
jgi:hypothetical protein